MNVCTTNPPVERRRKLARTGPVRHCRPILAPDVGEPLLGACSIDASLPDDQPDPGLVIALDASTGTDDFVATRQHFARESDPPRVYGYAAAATTY